MLNFKFVKDKAALADALGIKLKTLTYVLYSKKCDSFYETFEIPKKNGGTRTINAPCGYLKYIQKQLSSLINSSYDEYCRERNITSKISNAFEKGKSIITNARPHKNKAIVLNLDIQDFFESFHFGRVKGFFQKHNAFLLPQDMATIMAQLCCYNGKVPQGAPTSPIITNLIFNVVDVKILNLCKKYKLMYTRYADDLTFSSNDKSFYNNKDKFVTEIENILLDNGFKINKNKTRIQLSNSRQVVTGLVVNKIVNVNRDFIKKTRAMSEKMYRDGTFYISPEVDGTINQLEGRYTFINQLDLFNKSGKKKSKQLSTRESQFQKFLFYKYFVMNSKPLIITEGKTDINYIKAALKKNYIHYPDLISKTSKGFDFKVSFLKRSKKLNFFFKMAEDGADAMKRIYDLYVGNSNTPNLYKLFSNKYNLKPNNPVFLLFDNEQNNNKPLAMFKKYAKIITEIEISKNLVGNLYLLTHQLVKESTECEIEDLFDFELLETKIGGKTFSRNSDDNSKYYGKNIFSNYVLKNYNSINFDGFLHLLNELNRLIKEYKEKSLVN